MRCRPRIRTAFTITEVLFALSLLVIFFAATTDVFRSTVLLASSSQDLCDRSSQTDFAFRLLGADVWNSSTITLSDPDSLDVAQSDGTKISWKIDSTAGLTRTDAGGHSETWPDLAAKWTFAADKISVTISDGSAIPMRFPSQVLLSQSVQP
jgi:hypothetical protein